MFGFFSIAYKYMFDLSSSFWRNTAGEDIKEVQNILLRFICIVNALKKQSQLAKAIFW